MDHPQVGNDIWSEWLLARRFGGDSKRRDSFLKHLIPIRNRILEHAQLQGRETLLDVGAGDGLIAFGALERLEGSGQVIFCDISQPLLDASHKTAEEMGVLECCRFVNASADDLTALADGEVDVVTTRSVLIYVDDKARTFQEFYRVLKPGGRFSLFEPINRFGRPEPDHLFLGFDVSSIAEIAQKIKDVYQRIQPPDVDPMLNFDERDLLSLAIGAGFEEVHLAYEAAVVPKSPDDWESFSNVSGNPKIPSLKEAMAQALSADEARRFESHLRPLVEAGNGVARSAKAYLWGTKLG